MMQFTIFKSLINNYSKYNILSTLNFIMLILSKSSSFLISCDSQIMWFER